MHLGHPFVEDRFNFVPDTVGDNPVVGVDDAQWSDVFRKVVVTMNCIRTGNFLGQKHQVAQIEGVGMFVVVDLFGFRALAVKIGEFHFFSHIEKNIRTKLAQVLPHAVL